MIDIADKYRIYEILNPALINKGSRHSWAWHIPPSLNKMYPVNFLEFEWDVLNVFVTRVQSMDVVKKLANSVCVYAKHF